MQDGHGRRSSGTSVGAAVAGGLTGDGTARAHTETALCRAASPGGRGGGATHRLRRRGTRPDQATTQTAIHGSKALGPTAKPPGLGGVAGPSSTRTPASPVPAAVCRRLVPTDDVGTVPASGLTACCWYTQQRTAGTGSKAQAPLEHESPNQP